MYAALPGDCSAEDTGASVGGTLRNIIEVADSLGYSWRWERAFRRLTCIRQPVQIRFYEDNFFYYDNGVVNRLPVAPVRSGPTLVLPNDVVCRVLGGREEAGAGTKGRIKLSTPVTSGVTIQSLVTEKKSNGTLLTITLTDSLPLDVTYYYPNLTFNFFGGRLDTTVLRQGKRVGIVDSVFSVQFKQSAQITALLVREIEEPMIDYVSDTRTVMVSLWPKKQPPVKSVAPAVKPVKAPSGPMVVVLDPGHGGKDPGCIGADGTREKDVVLSIGLKIRDALGKKKNISVFMTRDSDVFIPLIDRTKIANDKHAHLFVSIHADAIGGNAKRKQSISGYKIYFLSQAKNEDDKLVAMRENAVIKLEEQPQKYSNIQNVLIEMAGNEYLRESQDLCIMLDEKFTSRLSKKIVKLHRGVGQANFWVLNGAFMPSVLIETGFLSHKKEAKLLTNKSFQKEMALSISDAITSFCDKIGVVNE
jgi:N-acetylmuramoyl-L-alanine amidase